MSDWRSRHVTDEATDAATEAVSSEDDPLATIEEGAAGEVESDLKSLAAEAAQYREHLQRLQAEFDNYRKRVQKEQAQTLEMASASLAHRLLEVADDFELALMHAEGEPGEQFVRGIELVYAKLIDALRAEGVEPMDALGAPFDPEQHEALMQEGDGDGEPVVSDVLRRGYTMKGRVLRPAGVKVKH